MPLEWHGDEVIAKVKHACREAINETTQAATDEAQTSHEWLNRTGNLEEKISTSPAHPDGDEIVGSFGVEYADGAPGVRDGFYGLFHELGTVHEIARPFIQPAGDIVFPTLAERIQRRMER